MESPLITSASPLPTSFTLWQKKGVYLEIIAKVSIYAVGTFLGIAAFFLVCMLGIGEPCVGPVCYLWVQFEESLRKIDLKKYSLQLFSK